MLQNILSFARLTSKANYLQISRKDRCYFVMKNTFKDPVLKAGPRVISDEYKVFSNYIVFTLRAKNLAGITSPVQAVYVQDGEKVTHMRTHLRNRGAQYHNIRFARKVGDTLFSFRNTTSKYERLVLQAKPVEYFETDRFFKLSKKAVKKYAKSEMKYVLLFEKQMMRFEESASKVFERIYKQEHVFFVLSKKAPCYDEIKAKYGDKIVSPDEDRYIEMVFRSKFIIGTEVPMHLLSLRSPNKHIGLEFCKTDKHKFIFLQHGVMFALSLNSPSRSFFKKNFIHSPYKVVVSSELEAKHFTDMGGYKRKDLWKTGLATFDGKKISADANKVVVMLTWRPWDEAKPLAESTYWSAVTQIFNSIHNKENLVLALHPKMVGDLQDDHPMKPYLYQGEINSLLNQTKVLITDYSSVSFDAFYRGTNLIFWWKDKEFCLKKYKNTLMLNERNIFGDICLENETLHDLVEHNRQMPQSEAYFAKYKKIVAHHDDNNTDRIIRKLRQEKVINGPVQKVA